MDPDRALRAARAFLHADLAHDAGEHAGAMRALDVLWGMLHDTCIHTEEGYRRWNQTFKLPHSQQAREDAVNWTERNLKPLPVWCDGYIDRLMDDIWDAEK